MNELEREITEIEMDYDDFAELVRATADCGGMTIAEMELAGWDWPMINLIARLRHAVETYDLEKEKADE